ncbi:MAG: hypothetical protein JSW07_19645 [bacterium]|nr:MAG: hypothetical protein JSW07_19645 [bacterium]
MDGHIIYDRNDFLKARFKKIRELIEQAGLSRRRFNDNFIRKFKKQPKFGWELTWEDYREF